METVKINGFWWEYIEKHPDFTGILTKSSGVKSWWLNGKLHREGGPAVEHVNGSKSWFLNGKRHREDGPAIEYADGDKAWYLNDINLTEKEWKLKIRKKKLKRIIDEYNNSI